MLLTLRPFNGAELTSCGSFARMTWLWIVCASVWATVAHCMTDEAIRSLRLETREIFYHGYDNYMRYAFPEDELRPLSCSPLTRDRQNPAHIEVNDVLGNYSLTLIDSLSTLAILASSPPNLKGRNRALEDFQEGITLLVEHYGDGTNSPNGQGRRARGFDLDSKVQVFETVIRGVGGLLSAHLFAVGELPIRGHDAKEEVRNGRSGIFFRNGFRYDGQLLRLAQDLAERLLPAFHTPTGLPYPRVNLRYGIPFYANSPYNADAEYGQCRTKQAGNQEITETCSAGAGSLVLEFTALSRLTGDPRFERAAKRAFWAVWERRSSLGLIGSGIDAETGHWVSPYTGIGAGIDSFFEYAFKSHVLLSGLPYDPEEAEANSPEAFLDVWLDAHDVIKRHVYRGAVYQHPHYIQSDLYTGALRAFWIDSLSAYYPGLLTLAGELDEAIETHLLYTALWTRYSALPERWSAASGNVEMGLRWWGGRPEFIESTWYLYRATQDPWYLHVGEMALRDIKRRCWTKCGWAGLQDVRTGEQSDRMESFFLGETAKYLFLLFDPTHPLNQLDAPYVFTTEGHPLIIPKRLRRSQAPDLPLADAELFAERRESRAFCPVPPPPLPFSISTTAARDDLFHAASLARLHLMPSIETLESPLVEFSADHPSISISDLQSPSNYTYYPWTLPPELVPSNAMSSRMAVRTTFDLSFPNLPNSLNSLSALQRVSEGILVNSMSGLRLGMVRENSLIEADNDFPLDDLFRIYAVSNIALGRDEKVFLSRETVSSFNPVDPFFTRTRDPAVIDLVIDAPPAPPSSGDLSAVLSDLLDDNGSSPLFNLDLPDIAFDLEVDPGAAASDPSYLSSLLQSLQSLLTIPTADPSSQQSESAPTPDAILRTHLPASLPTGPGSAPLPDIEEAALARDPSNPALQWTKIYIAPHDLCTERLDPQVPKKHHVIAVRRGGCSFSTKLSNIPAFAPSPSSLQLVVIVSYPEHDDPAPDPSSTPSTPLSENPKSARRAAKPPKSKPTPQQQQLSSSHQLIQPLLDAPQLSPTGLVRQNPIPLVMVNGGAEAMALLGRARGVGVRRRWHFRSQGVRIGNLIVL